MARLNTSGTGGQTDLPTRELVAGSTYWCVFPAKFAATSFNPNTYGDSEIGTAGGRFHPFESLSGTRVPTKYLADHENGALAETLLRDTQGERDVPLAEINSRRIARLRLRRSLQVADLTELFPNSSLGLLLQQGHEAYPSLRSVAATLHACRPDIEGLLWEGYQLAQPGMKCLMLFGDRVSGNADFGEIEVLELDSGTGLRALRAASRMRRFTLPKLLSLDSTSSLFREDRRPVGFGAPSHTPPAGADNHFPLRTPVATRDAANEQEHSPTSKQVKDLLAQLKAKEYRGFELYYQPQIRVPGRLIVGFEALLRWRSSDGDFIAPHDIHTLVERTGRSHAINEWVLQTACQEAADWPKTLSVAVNVSAAQFRNERFVESVSKALEQSGLAPTRLEIEIPEYSLIENVDFSLERLAAIRAMGVSVAMSEFGIGFHSSLLQLDRLSASKIKIDRAFMNGGPTEFSQPIVDALIAFGRTLGVEMVVEGVETVEEFSRLEAGQPCIVQGYVISRPIPATEIIDFLGSDRDQD